MSCACWNITTRNEKDLEILIELKERKIDICVISEVNGKVKTQQITKIISSFLSVTIKTKDILSVFEPDISKPKEGIEAFYDTLQEKVYKIPKHNRI